LRIKEKVRASSPTTCLFRMLALGVVAFLSPGIARATGTAIPHGTLELIAENQSIAPGHKFYVGLHFQLEKGWHVYWVNPGDSGEPPRVKWQLPAGVAAGTMEWPTPRRLGTSSIVDFGYEDAVMLIVPMSAGANLTAQQTARIGAEVKVLVCREMCIPGKAQISLTLPIKAQTALPGAEAKDLFAAARKSLPQRAPGNWRFSAFEAKDSFTLTANVGRQITQAIFFPVNESQIDDPAPQKLEPTAAGFRLTLRKSNQLLKSIDRLQGVLVLSADRSYSIDVPVTKGGEARNDNGMRIFSAQSLKEELRQ
jgi:DsbC/DsbD-like thiol-disulfide interchange protein